MMQKVGFTIRGRIVSERGEALPGIEVKVRYARRTLGFDQDAKTGADGRFQFQIQPLLHVKLGPMDEVVFLLINMVEVRSASDIITYLHGLCPRMLKISWDRPPGTVMDLGKIVLAPPTGSLDVEVVDAKGKPFANVSVDGDTANTSGTLSLGFTDANGRLLLTRLDPTDTLTFTVQEAGPGGPANLDGDAVPRKVLRWQFPPVPVRQKRVLLRLEDRFKQRGIR